MNRFTILNEQKNGHCIMAVFFNSKFHFSCKQIKESPFLSNNLHSVSGKTEFATGFSKRDCRELQFFYLFPIGNMCLQSLLVIRPTLIFTLNIG